MKKWLHPLLALLALLVPVIAESHEFWMLPRSFVVAPGGTTSLTLASGEDFRGDKIAFSLSVVAGLRHYSPRQITDLRGRVPASGELRELPVVLQEAGTHLIAFDTHPSSIVLPGDKFHAYLREEGLDAIVTKRERSGAADSDGRERFRRNTKTLIQVGDRLDATYAVRTGQRLEIVPLANPFTKRKGDELAFQVFFDGKPLSNALMRAWHKRGGQTSTIKSKTDARGKVTFALPLPGAWMVSAVHMVPARNSPDHDWDSYWGNLTFAIHDRVGGQ
ncbi:DUF4198 domain-containing protein [Caenimonas soli]|uniref:DUF4198 domain-containing protein n=1 Tax=Caenimonas soli TaxID=2735555 RepID=UPI00155223B8|nr:DUF4198 domain-containing protein [Caenimonas soli]NPC58698.1 DUF4198 domain-containing protein [Caenimonas soli]